MCCRNSKITKTLPWPKGVTCAWLKSYRSPWRTKIALCTEGRNLSQSAGMRISFICPAFSLQCLGRSPSFVLLTVSYHHKPFRTFLISHHHKPALGTLLYFFPFPERYFEYLWTEPTPSFLPFLMICHRLVSFGCVFSLTSDLLSRETPCTWPAISDIWLGVRTVPVLLLLRKSRRQPDRPLAAERSNTGRSMRTD